MTLLIAGLMGMSACRHKPPVVDGGLGGDLDPSGALQVAVVMPSQVPVNTPANVRIAGSGFSPGASVSVNGLTQTALVIDGNTLTTALPGLPAGVFDVTVTNADGASATLRNGLSVGSTLGLAYTGECASVTVFFGLDQASLPDPARDMLSSRLSCWNANESPLTVEGHADERGTTDYNLALGYRRAETIRSFLASQGIAGGRIRSVSWGEERPSNPGHDETAWATNRRGVVVPGR